MICFGNQFYGYFTEIEKFVRFVGKQVLLIDEASAIRLLEAVPQFLALDSIDASCNLG